VTGPVYHGWNHRPKSRGGSDPLPPLGHFEIKVFADPDALDGNVDSAATVVSTGDSKFVFAIPQDLHLCELVHAACYVTVAGAVTVQIRNVTQAYDFLSTRITVDTGEFSSYTAATQPVITPDQTVATGDLIAIDVDAADGTAQGLGVILMYAF
jgi:hypothetical protein